ncbi:MAG: oligosaccharide flippase family protein [Thermodesulfobacteriota bacterium]
MNETHHHDTLAKTIIKYSSSTIYRRVLGIFTAFLRPKLLSLELYGLWSLINIIPNYITFLPFGSRTAMRYEIPFNESAGATDRNEIIKGSVFRGTLVISIIASLALIAFSFKPGLGTEVRWGLITMALVVLLFWYYEYFITVLKSYQNFSLITRSHYLGTTVLCVSTIVLLFFFSIYGLYLSLLLTHVVVIYYLRSRHRLNLTPGFDLSVFLSLIKKGFPITLFSITTMLIRTSDKLVIGYFLGIKELGYYGIAIMVFSFLIDIPGASREVLEPKLLQSFGSGEKEKGLYEYFLKPLVSSAYLLPFIIGPAVIMLPVVIPLILPRYIPGIVPAEIIVIGSYFLSISYIIRGTIVASGLQLSAAKINIFTLAINVIINIILIKAGYGLIGVAIGSSLSFLFLLVCLLLLVKKKCGGIDHNWAPTISAILWPFPVMCVILVLLSLFASGTTLNEYMLAVVKLVTFTILMFIFLAIAKGRFELIKGLELKKLWNKK